MTTNTCDQLLDYYNRALTEKEEQEFENHLAECSDCQDELLELTTLSENLPYLSTPVNPPVGMKERVLSNVFKEEEEMVNPEPVIEKATQVTKLEKRKKISWSIATLAAALFLSLLGNIYSFSKFNEVSEGTPETFDTLVKDVELQSTTGENLLGTASLIEKNGVLNVVVKVKGLPEVEGEQVYQVWLLEEGQPFRAGSFIPNGEGMGVVTYEMNVNGTHTWDTVAITLEPNIHSQTPFGEVLLASEL